MKRIALLPTPADPFVLSLWLYFLPRWMGAIDGLYVNINTDLPENIVTEITMALSRFENVSIRAETQMTQHGTALSDLLDEPLKWEEDDLVMFVEDDGFVFRPRSVDTAFKMLESDVYDVLGSPRTSSSMDLQRIAAKRFNIDLSGEGDRGVAFWPNFFFTRRSILMKTDRDFNAHCWKKGEYIKELDWTVQPDEGDDIRGDTFVHSSLQIRSIVPAQRILHIPQYHCHPYWESEEREHHNMFDGSADWIHVGSLSGGMYGILTDNRGVPLALLRHNPQSLDDGWRLIDTEPTEQEQREFAKRVAFWEWGMDVCTFPIDSFKSLYRQAVDRVVDQYGLSRDFINRTRQTYEKLMV